VRAHLDTFAWYARASGESVNCDTTDCAGTPKTLAVGQGTVQPIAQDDTRVVWITAGQVRARLKEDLGSCGCRAEAHARLAATHTPGAASTLFPSKISAGR